MLPAHDPPSPWSLLLPSAHQHVAAWLSQAQPLWNACCCCSVTKSCPPFCNPMDYSPPGSFVHGIDSTGKNTRVSCHFLLQGIFPTQRANPRLLHWQAGPLPPSHLGRPCGMLEEPSHQGCSERHEVVPGPHQQPRPLPPGAPDCAPSRWDH